MEPACKVCGGVKHVTEGLSVDTRIRNGLSKFFRPRNIHSISRNRSLEQKMRIVVATGLNTGAAEYQNMGDVAMLQVAVARLLRL
jgi:hypothetical protein